MIIIIVKICILSLLVLFYMDCNSQGRPPWESPLKMAWSNDGTNFGNATIFQDSSGVPSIIKWKGDTLVCAFQWFRFKCEVQSVITDGRIGVHGCIQASATDGAAGGEVNAQT